LPFSEEIQAIASIAKNRKGQAVALPTHGLKNLILFDYLFLFYLMEIAV